MPPKKRSSLSPWFLWFLVVIVIWAVAFSAGDAANAYLYTKAGRLFQNWPAGTTPALLHEGDTVEREIQRTEKRTLIFPTVGVVEVSKEAVEECFAIHPLAPQDLGTLLSYLQRAGISTVGVSSPLLWDEEPSDMAIRMLGTALHKFKAAALGLHGRTAAQADFTPLALREYAIPSENMEGDSRGLPSANRPQPNGLTDQPDTVNLPWSPDWLEDEPLTQAPSGVATKSYPLLVRWNGEIIPTLPLRLALQQSGLSAKDVHVHFGKEISFGGRSFPIDQHGRIKLTTPKVVALPLSDVVGGQGEALTALGKEEGGAVILVEPIGGKPAAPRADLMARTLSELTAREHVEYFETEVPVGGPALMEDCLMLDWWHWLWMLPLTAFVLGVIPHTPTLLRRLVMAGGVCVLLYMAYTGLQEGRWMHLTADLAAWFATVLGIHFLKPQVKDQRRRRISR